MKNLMDHHAYKIWHIKISSYREERCYLPETEVVGRKPKDWFNSEISEIKQNLGRSTK